MGLDSDKDLGEGDRHETGEGAAALLDARPQQRALIGIEKKGSQVRGWRLGRDRAIGLGFGDDRGNVRRPGRIKVGQARTDQLALIGELVAEIAQQTAASEARTGVGLVEPLEMRAQALHRWDRLIGEAGAARIVAAVSLYDLGTRRLLALEVIVEGALRHTSRGRDVLDATAIESLLDQDLEPGVDDLL